MIKQKRDYIQNTIDNVQRFLDETCDTCQGNYEITSHLSDAFNDWCYENEFLHLPAIVFIAVLKKLGYPTLDDMCPGLALR